MPDDAVPAPASAHHHTQGHVRAILRRRDFRRLLEVRGTSQLADGFFQAGLAVSVFFDPSKQVEPMAYAVAFAMLVAPYSLLGPYVGVFLDRWSRRSILAVSNLTRALLVIPTAILILTSSPEWIFGVVAMCVITINRFVLAGLSAAQPHVVEPPHLVTANSFATTLGTVCFGGGLAASYLVIQLASTVAPDVPQATYAAAAITAAPLYALSALIAWRSYTRSQLGPDETERATGRMWDAIVAISIGMLRGFAHLWRRRGAAYVMTAQAGHRALYGILAVSTLALFREYFHNPAYAHYEDTLGWLAGIAAAGQVGSFLAAVITPRASRLLRPGRWVSLLLAMAILVVATLGFNVVQQFFVVGTFLINIVSQGIKITVDTSLQSRVDDEYRGRLFSLNDTVYNVSFIIGMFVGASLLPDDGMAPWLLLATSGGYVVLTSWYYWASERHSPYDLPSAVNSG